MPVILPRSSSSPVCYRTEDGVLSPSRNLCLLAPINPSICLVQPPHQSSCNYLKPKLISVVYGRRNKASKRKGGYKRGGKQVEEEFTDEDDSDYDDDFELESGSGFRDVRIKVSSLRMDAILKAGLNMSRNKVETAFYASKIRINGDKVLKKSNQVHEGDELDVVQNVSSVNPDLLNISRIVLLRVGKYDEDSDKFEIKLRKYPQLLVPKYGGFPSEEDDPNVPH